MTPVHLNIPTIPNVEFPVPVSLARLVDLAYNLWWSWNGEGRDLWAAIDPVGWDTFHNPIELLASLDRSQWATIEQMESVREGYHTAVGAFDRYMAAKDTWYQRRGTDLAGPVAYLCTEFGVNESLPFYSGGLGILAGDHVKAASDLGLPFVAVGLLYRRGYFRQEVDLDGDQQHIYPTLDLRRLPVRPIPGPTGGWLKVGVEFPDREVLAAVWKLEVGRVPLLLLDTDLPENHPADRPITHQLYVAGREMRFCQELILGVGAVRALAALRLTPSVWHVNEGHAALSLIERMAEAVEAGDPLEAAQKRIRSATAFTLHTPVPAGNEVYDAALATKYLGPWAARMRIEVPDLVALAAAHESDVQRFDMGALAIKLAAFVNGVSRRHGEVVSQDWRHLMGADAAYITNGVHTPTWIGRAAAADLARNFGRTWPIKLLEQPELVEQARLLSDVRIWRAHEGRKEIFTTFARGRIRRQLARHGASPDELRAVDDLLPPGRLTIGFGRRFATYKRATLMFSDWDRLRRTLTDPERPIQVVFAGKAHPADQQGQAFIRQIVELSRSLEFRGHVYLLEDYDARMARFMVQGCDVWVNNPRPPMEASGTSGMKAAINGTLNVSILDGWWPEGYNGRNGWAFGSSDVNGDWASADQADAQSFYDVIANEVAPLFYQRDAEGLPTGWIERMREAFISSVVRFSTHRMVAEYCQRAYDPLGASAR